MAMGVYVGIFNMSIKAQGRAMHMTRYRFIMLKK